jgi:hypothetical protein
MMMMKFVLTLAGLVGFATAFDYSITGAGSIVLTDQETGITDCVTIFTDEFTDVFVDGIEWDETGVVDGSDDLLFWETSLDGEVQASGSMSLADVGRELPTSLSAGSVKPNSKGSAFIEVKITVDGSSATTNTSAQAYAAGLSIIPL